MKRISHLRRYKHRRLVLALIPLCFLLGLAHLRYNRVDPSTQQVQVIERRSTERAGYQTSLPSPPPPPPPPSPLPPPPPIQRKPKIVQPPRNNEIYKFYAEGRSYYDTNTTCPVAWEWTEIRGEADVVLENILDGSMGFFLAKEGEPLPRDYPEQLYAFMSLESGINYPYIFQMDEFGYNFSVDYRIWPDHPKGPADIPAVYMFNPTSSDFNIKFRAPPKLPKRTDALMAAFISNCANVNGRLDVLKELIELIGVHSYGVCEHNIDEPEDSGVNRGEQKRQLSGEYKFLFTPENTNDMSYATEKVYDALAMGAIPVYLGAPDIYRFIPDPSAVINAADFNSTAALAKYLIELGNDDEKYMKHFEWKKKKFSPEFDRVMRLATRTVECRMALTLSGKDYEEDLKNLDICPTTKDC